MATAVRTGPRPCPFAAAEILAEVDAGHEEAAEAIAAAHWMSDLSNAQLHELARYGRTF